MVQRHGLGESRPVMGPSKCTRVWEIREVLCRKILAWAEFLHISWTSVQKLRWVGQHLGKSSKISLFSWTTRIPRTRLQIRWFLGKIRLNCASPNRANFSGISLTVAFSCAGRITIICLFLGHVCKIRQTLLCWTYLKFACRCSGAAKSWFSQNNSFHIFLVVTKY